MATFVWDPAVQWPPPAHILLNYDVVAPGGAVLSLHSERVKPEERMSQPFLALITPLGGGHPDQGLPGSPPGYWGGVAPPYPDQGLPGGQPHPSHPIAPGGRPPGYWGGVAPPYPDQGLPGSQPHPSHPIAPGGRPPGYWGGVAPPYPDQGLPGQPPGYWGGVAPPYPDHGLPPSQIQPPPGGQPVPPDQIAMPDPPADLADDVLVSVYKPGQGWTTTSYDVPAT